MYPQYEARYAHWTSLVAPVAFVVGVPYPQIAGGDVCRGVRKKPPLGFEPGGGGKAVSDCQLSEFRREIQEVPAAQHVIR